MSDRIAVAEAPAAIGNVAVGFDVLGHSFSPLADRVRARRTADAGVRILAASGAADGLPLEPERNTAGRAVQSLLAALRPSWGVELTLEKGIPPGAGLGGSAASAVAAVVATNALLDRPLPDLELLTHAVEGEAVAAGERIADNVAPSLLGGLILTLALDPPRVQRIPVPARIRCVVVHPRLFRATRAARALLRPTVDLRDAVRQTAYIAGFIAGCHTGDLDLIGQSLRDAIVEPQRAALVPGFAQAQTDAMAHGALGCSISGAGPSLFAWCDAPRAEAVGAAIARAIERAGASCDRWSAPIGTDGARVVARA